MLESKLEKACVVDVEARGGLMLKWVSPGQKGVPDRIIFWPGGEIHLVELKKPGGPPPTFLQQLMHYELRARGAKVWVISTPAEWTNYLKEVGK